MKQLPTPIKLEGLSLIPWGEDFGGIEVYDGREIERCFKVSDLIRVLKFYETYGELPNSMIQRKREEEDDV